MLTWPIYSVITLYILSSPLLNGIIMTGGLYSPLFLIIGALPVLLIAFVIGRRGANSYLSIIYCASLFIGLITATGLTVSRYLYHSRYALIIVVFLLIGSAFGIITKEVAVGYASKILGIVSGLLFVFIISLSLRAADFSDLWPVASVDLNNAIISIIRSFFAFTPLLLPLVSSKTDAKFIFPLVSCGSVIIISTIYLLIYPYSILTEEKNLIIEISKNISLGRFFQRMEFVSVMIFLILSILILIYIISVIKLLVMKKVVSKSKFRIALGSIFIFIVSMSLLAVSDRAVTVIAAWIAGISIILAVLLSCLRSAKKAVLPVICCLLLSANLSSCIEYSEVDTFAYPQIVGVEKAGNDLRFYFRTEDATYSVFGKSIVDAQKAVNRQNAKQLDLSQLGMVIAKYDQFDVLSEVVGEIQDSYIHNTVQIAVTDTPLSELEKAEFSAYSSIGEFLNEYKSILEKFEVSDNTAFKVYINNEKGGASLIPRVTISDGEMLIEGAVAYGNKNRLTLSNQQLNSINDFNKDYSYDYNVIEQDRILEIDLKPKSNEVGEDQAALIEELYNKTGFDVCNVYAKIARNEWNENEYLNKMRNIKKIVVKIID